MPLSFISNDIMKQENIVSDKVAVYADNGLFLDSLGRLDRGYNIINLELAEAWMKNTNKVRLATAQEVADAYGV